MEELDAEQNSKRSAQLPTQLEDERGTHGSTVQPPEIQREVPNPPPIDLNLNNYRDYRSSTNNLSASLLPYGFEVYDQCDHTQFGQLPHPAPLNYQPASNSSYQAQARLASGSYGSMDNMFLSREAVYRLQGDGYDLIAHPFARDVSCTPHIHSSYPYESEPPLPDASPGRSISSYPRPCVAHGILPVLYQRKLSCGCDVFQDVNGQTLAKASSTQ